MVKKNAAIITLVLFFTATLSFAMGEKPKKPEPVPIDEELIIFEPSETGEVISEPEEEDYPDDSEILEQEQVPQEEEGEIY